MPKPSPKTLFLFTDSFPYGKSETFLESELPFLAEAFAKIIVVYNKKLKGKRKVAQNVRCLHFPYHLSRAEKVQSLKYIFSKDCLAELFRLMFTYKKRPKRGILATMMLSFFKSRKLSIFIENLLEYEEIDISESIFYSYWCNDLALGLAQYGRRHPKAVTIARAHGWDVYFEASRYGYLPFRKLIFDQLTAVFFISDYGKKYSLEMNPDVRPEKMKIARLGTKRPSDLPPKKPKTDERIIFRIVSCSNIIALKRLGLMVEALKILATRLEKEAVLLDWLHFGDGLQRTKVEKKAAHLLDKQQNISYHFAGRVANADVLAHYHETEIDVFLNLSRSEGVPVSIMEAFSFGIPAVATAVGGVPEIVNAQNGWLLPANPDKKQVADVLVQMCRLSPEAKTQMRKAALSCWQNHYNANKNYPDFIKKLHSF